MLAQIRSGTCSADLQRELESECSRALPVDDGILPTKLFTHREDVDALNNSQLAQLEAASVRHTAEDFGSADTLNSACPVRQSVGSTAQQHVVHVHHYCRIYQTCVSCLCTCSLFGHSDHVDVTLKIGHHACRPVRPWSLKPERRSCSSRTSATAGAWSTGLAVWSRSSQVAVT